MFKSVSCKSSLHRDIYWLNEVEDYPNGYPKLAAYADSDDAFMIYRRFGLLHARLLLNKQDELRKLEEDLYTMDKRDDRSEPTRIYLQCATDDIERKYPEERQSRQNLLQQIETKDLEYGKY